MRGADEVVFDDQDAVYADWEAARLLLPLAGLILVLGIGGFVVFRLAFGSDGDPEVESTATPQVGLESDESAADPRLPAQRRAVAFAAALTGGSLLSEPFAFESPAEAQSELDRITGELGSFDVMAVAGDVVLDGDLRAASPLLLEWTLDDGTMFSTTGELQLALVGTDWKVDWDPSLLHAGLTPGDRLVRERVISPRAPILGQDGFEVVGNRPTLQVAVVTRDVTSIDQLSSRLAELLDLDGPTLADRLRRSPSDALVPVAEDRTERLEPIRAELAALPGVVVADSALPLTPYDGFGRALLGWAGEVTAEILERSPTYFEAGDIVGRSGLQAVYNERLAGLPGFQVRIDRRFPLRDEAGQEIPADAEVNIVYLSAPQPPEIVQTTIDHRVQTAAEQALGVTERPSSLVAVRASTGEVLAVANGPGAAVENLAMTGQYPPGSIFKIATAYAALERGAGANLPIGCPATMVVDGREFRNSDGNDLGTVSVLDAFAQSCNTSFIDFGLAMEASAVPDAARRLGVGADYQLGTNAFSGTVPIPGSQTERAATAFGQSRVLVSPLSMAVMAASVAGGAYRAPSLVVTGSAAAEAAPPALVLDPAVIEQLRQMMAAVVTSGTGRALAAVPGGPVFGKTGTAEFGNDDPPATHAWFVGFQGDLAFAVLVDGGGFGGSVAAPIAADFLRRVAGAR